MTQPIRIRSASDVLTSVPELLGYVPRNSLVVIPLAHQHGRACIRIDLPGPSDPTDPITYATMVLGQVLRLPDTRQILLAVFSDDEICDERIPFAEHIVAIEEIAALAGIGVHSAQCRAANSWSSYRGIESGTLRELDGFATARASTSFEDFAKLPAADPEHRRALRRVLRVDLPLREPIDLADVLNAWESLLNDELAGDRELQLEAQALVAVGFRDAQLTEMQLANAVYGPEAVAELGLLWSALMEESEVSVTGVIQDLIESEPIDIERTAAGIAMLRGMVAALPRVDAGNALAVLGWLEWARGSSSLAAYCAEKARRLGCVHPLLDPVHWMADNGITPGWVSEAGLGGGLTETDFERLLGVRE